MSSALPTWCPARLWRRNGLFMAVGAEEAVGAGLACSIARAATATGDSAQGLSLLFEVV